MKVDVINLEGKKVDTVDLSADIFDAPVNVDLMHQAYVRQMANARLGTHSTKGRSEVRGGGRKPWRQKGTGRARQGSIRAAQWVGGGKIHTPKPRDYYKKMPRKMRQAALKSALSAKATTNDIVVIDDLRISEPKTKIIANALKLCVGDASTLILVPEKSDDYRNFELSVRNLPGTKTILVNYLNIRDLLGFERILLPIQALEKISAHLG